MTHEHAVEEISLLYRPLIQAWNAHDAEAFGALFTPDGTSIGFDGSTMGGRDEITGHIEGIFADHEPARYLTKIRDVRLLAGGAQLQGYELLRYRGVGRAHRSQAPRSPRT